MWCGSRTWIEQADEPGEKEAQYRSGSCGQPQVRSKTDVNAMMAMHAKQMRYSQI